MGLGEANAGPSFERGVLQLKYTGGALCPDDLRSKSAVIRFQCDKDKVVRDPPARQTSAQGGPWRLSASANQRARLQEEQQIPLPPIFILGIE